MKILLIGDYPPPHGGVAVHVQQLHRYLRGCGVEATVLDIGKGGRPAPDVLPVHTGSRFLMELSRFAAKGWLPHLHTSGNNAKAWMVVSAVGATARLFRADAVATLHSGLLPAFLAASAERRLLARGALAGYAQVIAVSEAVADALAGAGVPPSKILVYPAFCASQVTPGPAPAGFAEARARRSPLLVMAHHPSPVYGRALMLRALRVLAERHPRIGLAVFGPGTGAPAFLKDAEAAGVADRIEDFAELEHPQALALIGACDAFVRPTTADGDSISVREALSLGVPCVASDVCARPAGTTVFRGGDPEDLAAQVERALASGPVRVPAPDAGPVVLGLYQTLREAKRPAVPAPAGP